MGMRIVAWAVAVSFLLALGRVPLDAAPGLPCEVGRPVTISVVVREETHWSIWLNRMSTECPMSAVVVDCSLPTREPDHRHWEF